MRELRGFLYRYWRARSGAAAVEYALMLAIVCCGIAVGASKLSGSVNEAVTEMGACLQQPISCLLPS